MSRREFRGVNKISKYNFHNIQLREGISDAHPCHKDLY